VGKGILPWGTPAVAQRSPHSPWGMTQPAKNAARFTHDARHSPEAVLHSLRGTQDLLSEQAPLWRTRCIPRTSRAVPCGEWRDGSRMRGAFCREWNAFFERRAIFRGERRIPSERDARSAFMDSPGLGSNGNLYPNIGDIPARRIDLRSHSWQDCSGSLPRAGYDESVE
jgi:hypothetical protein